MAVALLILATVGQAPVTALILAIRKDGSPFRRSFWTAGEDS